MATQIQKITDRAEKLYDIRKAINAKEEENKKELDGMKAEKEALQASLIADMNKSGLVTLKVKSGDTFTKSTKKSLEITNEAFAFKWALEHRAVSVNKILVAQMLKDKDIPTGFKQVETEFISVRKAKNEEI